MAKLNKKDIGYIRRSEEEGFQIGELSAGDFVCGSLNEDNPRADVEVCIIEEANRISASLITGRYRQMVWMGKASEKSKAMHMQSQLMSDITLIPLAEDWFAENSAIFRKMNEDEMMRPKDTNLKVAFSYEFKARRWHAEYFAVGFEITFMDNDLYDKLQQEGLSWVACETNSKGRAIIVQIVKPINSSLEPSDDNKYKVGKAAAVAQFVAVHELQHFLRLCGIFDAMNIPKRLLDDAEEMARLFGRKKV